MKISEQLGSMGRGLSQATVTKTQAESAGRSLLNLAKEVERLEAYAEKCGEKLAGVINRAIDEKL
jgi:hypothetical protein